MHALLVLALLAQTPPPPPDAAAALALRAGLEAGPEVLGDAAPGGEADGHLRLVPVVGLTALEGALLLELGAEVRLRVVDAAPAQGRGVRAEDWDERSDWGQLLRGLRVGAPDGGAELTAGPLWGHTLGHGHLVRGYSNRLQPDYHPAGAAAVAHAGPARVDVLVGDVLGARLFAGELRLDVPRALGARAWDRAHVALSGAHDAGRAGGRAPGLTALQADADVALWKGARAQAWAVAGAGTRMDGDGAGGVGASAGVVLEGLPDGARWALRLEARRHAARFRPGLLGPDWELGRFADVGRAGRPRAEATLPTGAAGYAEARLALGAETAARVTASAAVERFPGGRWDADTGLAWEAAGGRAQLLARALVSGAGVAPRTALHAEARLRLAPSLYAVAGAARLHLVTPERTLQPALQAHVGLGVDAAWAR